MSDVYTLFVFNDRKLIKKGKDVMMLDFKSKYFVGYSAFYRNLIVLVSKSAGFRTKKEFYRHINIATAAAWKVNQNTRIHVAKRTEDERQIYRYMHREKLLTELFDYVSLKMRESKISNTNEGN